MLFKVQYHGLWKTSDSTVGARTDFFRTILLCGVKKEKEKRVPELGGRELKRFTTSWPLHTSVVFYSANLNYFCPYYGNNKKGFHAISSCFAIFVSKINRCGGGKLEISQFASNLSTIY